MKYIILFLFLPFIGFSQGGTWPVKYNDSDPSGAPSAAGTRLYFNTATNTLWFWEPAPSSTWRKQPKAFDQISGCAAPAYTPTARQSTFAVNACTPPELYQYTGAAWELLNAGTTYTAGTGIDITGGVITNTSPNIVQTLSIAGQDLTLSGGGGTVAIPGVSWPLLAPPSGISAPSYSFAGATTAGLTATLGSKPKMFLTGKSGAGSAQGMDVFMASGGSENGASGSINISGGIGSNIGGNGGNVSISGGNALDSGGGNGGSFVMNGGISTDGSGGSFTAAAGGGAIGGVIEFAAGSSSYAKGGNANFYAGAGFNGNDGGNINIIAGTGDSGQNGKIILFGDGVLLPNLATSQRDALIGVSTGQTIFCTDATATDGSTGVMQAYNGSAWKDLNGDGFQSFNGNYTSTGTATTAFTVTLPTTQPDATYSVSIMPKNALSATGWYISARTTTTFTITYLTGLTGAVDFDYIIVN